MAQTPKAHEVTDPVILIASGDEECRAAVRGAIQAADFVVEQTRDGLEAVSAFLRHRPQLVIFDAVLPQMSGLEACKALRKMAAGADVPIIILVDQDDTASVKRAYSAGASDFVTKPVNLLMLGPRIRFCMRAWETLSKLKKDDALRALALRAAQLGHWEWDLTGGLLYFSDEVHEIFGQQTTGSASGLPEFLGLVHPADRTRVKEAFSKALAEGTPFQLEYRILHSDGGRIVRQDGFPVGALETRLRLYSGTVKDITKERSAEAEIQFLEHFDALTRLPNRSLFQAWLDQAVANSDPDEAGVAVFMCNLDAFKRINESLGHRAGDDLLRMVSERLQKALGYSLKHQRVDVLMEERILSRPGADEFLFAARSLTAKEAIAIAEKALESFLPPFNLEGREIVVKGSIGISRQAVAGRDAGSLLRAAETALQDAKLKGWGSYELFAPSDRTQPLVRLDKEAGLRRALEKDELAVHCQPQIDIASGCFAGVEALIRWQHPVRGLLGPASFLKLAEQTDLIIPIGQRVLTKACLEAAEWFSSGLPPVVVSVNVSARQFARPEFVASVRTVLEESGLLPERLELEVTETILMQNIAEVAGVLGQLRSMGVRVAIDDFGTGYSSLSYLRRLPIQTLKIDRSFVHDVGRDQDNAAITATIIAMAHRLNLEVIAEGVETEEECRVLKEQGCRIMQGFLFHKALASEEIVRLLKAQAQRCGPGQA